MFEAVSVWDILLDGVRVSVGVRVIEGVRVGVLDGVTDGLCVGVLACEIVDVPVPVIEGLCDLV